MIMAALPTVSVAANAVCKIGSTEYSTFDAAVSAANAANTDVIIELLQDVSVREISFKNANGKRITVNGNGHTVASAGGNNALMINSDMTFKDLTVVHNNQGSAFQIYTCSDVRLENVIIDATAQVQRNYTLINALGTGAKTALTLQNVDIKMSCDPAKSGALSAVRTGNGGGDVDISLVGCEIDVSAAAGACGLLVTGNTAAHLDLKNTVITTGGMAIKANGQAVELTDCLLRSTQSGYYDNDSRLIEGSQNVIVHSQDSTRMYAVQSTPAAGGKTDIRIVAALKADELGAYDRLLVKVTAAYGNTVYFENTYNLQTVYESLKYKDGQGITGHMSLDGYYMAPVVIGGLDVRESETYLTVELYTEKDGEQKYVDLEGFTFKGDGFADNELDAVDYSINRAELTGRYLMVSDVHFTTLEQSGYANRVTYRGYSNKQRMEMMCDEIRTEYYRRGLDAILVLGDLSTDDYPLRHPNTNFCKLLYLYYLKPLSEELNIPVLMVAGNHDSYPNDMWVAFAGRDRQFVWENPKNGDVFLMLDSYNTANGNTAHGGGGSNWTGIDEVWIEEQLEKYKDRENIFLATHWFGRGTDEPEIVQLNSLIEKYPNVRAMFDAHSHTYDVHKLSSGRYIVNDGAYSYDCIKDDVLGKYNFDNLRLNNLWGFHILEVTDETVRSYQVNTEHTYTCDPGSVNTQYYVPSYYTPYVKFEEIIQK